MATNAPRSPGRHPVRMLLLVFLLLSVGLLAARPALSGG